MKVVQLVMIYITKTPEIAQPLMKK